MASGTALNPSDLIMDTLAAIETEGKLVGYSQSLSSISGSPGTGIASVSSNYENAKIVHSAVLSAGKAAQANYYALRERELVIASTLVGVLLFSAVLMFLLQHFPAYAWLLSMVVSGCAITGVAVGVYSIGNYSIVNGGSFSDQANSSPLDATLSVSMPFIIFATVVLFIAAAAAFVIWMQSRSIKAAAAAP